MERRSIAFVVLSGPEGPGSIYQVQRSQSAIGREQGDVILENDRFVDELHASLSWEAGAPVIEDQGSVNGTWKRLGEAQQLQHGDELRIGQQIFIVEQRSAPSTLLDDGTHYITSQQYGGRLRLRQLLYGGMIGAQLVDAHDDFTLGAENPVFAHDEQLSGMHARVWADEQGSIFAQDLGSLNGTWVRLKGATPLSHGDQIMVGESALCVILAS